MKEGLENHKNKKKQKVTDCWDGGTWDRPYGFLELVSQEQCEESCRWQDLEWGWAGRGVRGRELLGTHNPKSQRSEPLVSQMVGAVCLQSQNWVQT